MKLVDFYFINIRFILFLLFLNLKYIKGSNSCQNCDFNNAQKNVLCHQIVQEIIVYVLPIVDLILIQVVMIVQVSLIYLLLKFMQFLEKHVLVPPLW